MVGQFILNPSGVNPEDGPYWDLGGSYRNDKIEREQILQPEREPRCIGIQLDRNDIQYIEECYIYIYRYILYMSLHVCVNRLACSKSILHKPTRQPINQSIKGRLQNLGL